MDDIAFLHTSPVHVPTFDGLMRELAPRLRVAHSVREDLLADAQQQGVEFPPLVARVQKALAEAAAGGAAVVVCTCSTLGGLAEAMTGTSFQVTRIDRAMADQAARNGPQVLLVAALQSTLAPTAALLQSSAERLGLPIEIHTLLVAQAWGHFQAGRQADYLQAVANAIVRAAPGGSAIVLAQASMAPAAELLAALGLKALTSPRLGVEHAVALYPRARTR
ncbi:MAG: Asp/Glu/hydantoin racemase [Cytophagales bacterium]|nr:Asp/Glu/hydantoin racemase [Rhizobacter sp.]